MLSSNPSECDIEMLQEISAWTVTQKTLKIVERSKQYYLLKFKHNTVNRLTLAVPLLNFLNVCVLFL